MARAITARLVAELVSHVPQANPINLAVGAAAIVLLGLAVYFIHRFRALDAAKGN